MGADVQQQYLFEALKEELAGAETLRGMLERETEALNSLQMDDLSSVVDGKHAGVVALQAAAERRNRAVAALGYAADASGVVAFMSEVEVSASMRELWGRLTSEITACAELNQRNEILNFGGQRRVRQLLRLLRGEAVESLTYDQLAPTRGSSPKHHDEM